MGAAQPAKKLSGSAVGAPEKTSEVHSSSDVGEWSLQYRCWWGEEGSANVIHGCPRGAENLVDRRAAPLAILFAPRRHQRRQRHGVETGVETVYWLSMEIHAMLYLV